MPTSLRARFIFPVDRPPIENGVVTFDGEKITDVGNTTTAGDIIDLGSVALLPGLVNAHTHLEFSYLRQPLGTPGMSLVDWIRLVIAERGRSNYDPDQATLEGRWECRAAGSTTIGDIITARGRQQERHQRFYAVGDTYFIEVIGFSRARAESALNALTNRREFGPRDLTVRLVKNLRNRFRGISPHAPYTVSPKLLHDLVVQARRLDMPMAMHIAESHEELQLLRNGTGPFQQLLEERSMWDPEAIPLGSTPFDYLTMLANAPLALIIHGNYLDDDELQFLATHRDRMSLVYCPRTHAYFRHSPYPLSKALATGVRVALGTDSRASNPDLSLLSEMRFIAQAYPSINPEEVLHMGTLSGAEALGRESEVGSITPGKVANLVAIPLSEDFTGNEQDALTSVLASNEAVNAVWLRGKRLEKTSVRSPLLDGEG